MNRKLKLWELERVNEEVFKKQKKFPVIVLLDDIRSLHNIGTFFRTSDAFNIEKIVLGGITASPPHREINKTALGATETVVWEYKKELIEEINNLRKEGYFIVSVEQSEKTTLLNEINSLFFQKIAIIFGNEVDGIQQDLIDQSDAVLEIPQFGTKHSLNVSVCAGIVLWEVIKRWIK
ncbi:MAG: TrmH family RNA methyltransferase [Flavobacteriia bacterium]|nr:TrmH family RNA methyltransferase [Flavobacteriia bacterium]